MTIRSSNNDILEYLQKINLRDNDNLIVPVAIVTVTSLVVGWIFIRTSRPANSCHVTETDSSTDTTSAKTQKSVDNDGKLRNVFSVKQRPPLPHADKKVNSSDRPFGSSYYYAHNNSNSKGGYADGLRAEDYVMNGPKLLSKGGVRVDHENHEPGAPEATIENKTTPSVEKPKFISSSASKQITRYLWEDDGGDIAKIHIDCLYNSSTETMSWEDASVSKDDVKVRLIGEDCDGLMVSVTTKDQKKFHLHVAKMYGSADSVKAVVKKHKLLIKITKRKIRRRSSNNEGLMGSVTSLFGRADSYVSVKWPQLNSFGAEIDEKRFKEVDFKDMDDSYD